MASVIVSVLGAITVAITLPMIDTYGTAVTYLLCAVLIWMSYGNVVVLEKQTIHDIRSRVMLHHQIW